ncbi:MAG: ArsR family transcriptional regulator [Leptospiraceae bacterium]|jgi:predicted transcriptional regulator|nr:ArsR family transcriptional regulator [Leptospiraceae bacterium]MCZ8344892.1 ArsR family transcriptional regulator [Leptospiraceae bacterium]PJE01557.1 MAG: ArsR family transcriptional regulator [Leptospira sp.]
MPKVTKKELTIIQKRTIDWTFLSNHAHVLICLYQNSEMLLREVAILVGITERAVQAIVRDLVDAKILLIEKEGRRNRYKIKTDSKLRHPLEENHSIKELLALGNR